MKYEVHIYAIVRVKVVDIEAESQQEAIRKAESRCDLYALFQQNDREPNTEYAEDIDSFLVDEVGDEEHEHSRWYDKHAKPRRSTRRNQETKDHDQEHSNATEVPRLRALEMKGNQITKTRTRKLYSYRFEIQEDKLILCFSVVAGSQAEAVRKANCALAEEHAVQTSAFNPAKVCLPEPIEDAVLYLADKQDKPITVDTGSIVDFVEVS